ncbi:O-antigen ligase family protein [bacterium]|nr:O-antigen ligase family protein [bacterium]
MKLPAKSVKTDFDIKDFYAVKVGVLWKAFKVESPAFWWLCIYFFLEYIRPASLYPILDFLPWTQLALIFALIAAINDKNVKWVSSNGNILLILFYLMVVLSGVFAFQPSLSFDKINIVINWIVVYFLFICIVNTEKKFFMFLLLFLIVNFKMSQHGFVSFASRGFAYANWGVSGAPGWFQDSGDFGIAMLIFSGAVISFTLALRKYWGRYKKLFFYFMAITGLVTIIATSSRGAQLGMVGMGVWVLLKSRLGIKALLGIVLIGSLLYVLLPEEMFEEYQTAGDDGTSQDRLAHWDFGIDVALENPLLGIGYENWLTYCNFMNPNGLGYKSTCRLPHNTYVSAAAETGLVSLALYILLALYMFNQNAKSRRNAKNSGNTFIYHVSHGLDAGLFGYLIASIFFTVLFYPLFWVQLAMVVALNNVSKKLEVKFI